MTFKKIGLIILFVSVFLEFGNAQVSIAYANLNELISMHPDAKTKNAELDAYQKNLEQELEAKESYIEGLYQSYMEKKAGGATEATLKPLEQQITKLNNEAENAANQADSDLEAKRNLLFSPMLDDITKALGTVSARHQIQAVFQPTDAQGVSFVLVAPDETDVTAEILKEIGVVPGVEYAGAKAFKLSPAEVSIGYTNVEYVLSAMPGIPEMNNSLEAYRTVLIKNYEAQQAIVMKKYDDYSMKKESGTAPEATLKALETEIQKMDEVLNQVADEMEEKLMAKRNALLLPILDKLQAGIDKVAAKNGFTFILNQSNSSGVSTIVFGPEECDITQALCKELGISTGLLVMPVLEAKKNIKIGYVNVELALGQMEEMNEVQSELVAYETTLRKNITNAQNSGATEELINKLVQEAEAKLYTRQGALLEPIMMKIQTKIDELGKELGYDYIINETGMNIIHTDPAFMLTDKLMKKLGVVK